MVTDPDVQGRGHGRGWRGALEIMRASGADLGVFTCDRDLQPFYESAGWTHLAATVLVGGSPEHPYPSDQLDKVTMAPFFSARARAAASSFVGSRTELYPGLIDTLW